LQRVRSSWWNRYAGVYDRIWDSPWTKALSHEICGDLGNECSGTVLELGCGTGLVTKHLIDAGYEVVAVDNNDKMLSIATERCPAVRFINGDIADFTIESDLDFDIIVAANVLHICDDLSGATRAIMNRFASKSKTMVLTWPTNRITLLKMLFIDIKYGRGFWSAVRAHMLRMVSGFAGALLRVRRNTHEEIIGEVRNQLPPGCKLQNRIMEGAQHLATITAEGVIREHKAESIKEI
jgi:SAM-dependent methyltransferase